MLNKKILPKKEHLSEVDDADLWIEAKAGNRKVYDFIVQKYYSTLLKYGKSIHNHEDDIKDAIHDLFVNIWVTRNNLTDVKSLKYYLLLSLRRLVLKNLSRSRKNNSKILDYIVQESTDEQSIESKIIDITIDKERSFKLKKAIADLPVRQREAITLRFFDDLSYPEVVSILGISYESTRNLISQAIKSLREKIV